MKWAVTGANGNVGRRLIEELLRNTSAEIVAIVRSDRAKKQVVSALTHTPVELAQRVSTVVLDYTDVSSMCCVLEGVTCVVHLVGIINQRGTKCIILRISSRGTTDCLDAVRRHSGHTCGL